MKEEIFLQVVIILVIAILGSNQKKTLINSANPIWRYPDIGNTYIYNITKF